MLSVCMLGWNLSEGPDLWKSLFCVNSLFYVGRREASVRCCAFELGDLHHYLLQQLKKMTQCHTMSHIWMCCKHRDQDQRHFFRVNYFWAWFDSSGHPAQSPCRSLVEPVLCSEFRQLSLRKNVGCWSGSPHGIIFRTRPHGVELFFPTVHAGAKKTWISAAKRRDNDVKWWTQTWRKLWHLGTDDDWRKIRNECGWQCRKTMGLTFYCRFGGPRWEDSKAMGDHGRIIKSMFCATTRSSFKLLWYNMVQHRAHVYIYNAYTCVYIYIYKCMHIYI